MFKHVLQRGLLGFPLGVFIGYTITVGISLAMGRAELSPVVPSLTESMGGNEMNAVILQYLLSGMLGAGLAAGSVLWENENWSIAKRTLAHFAFTALWMFPVAYITQWMDRSLAGVMGYVGVFVALYALIWLAQYLFWMRKVHQINQHLQSK